MEMMLEVKLEKEQETQRLELCAELGLDPSGEEWGDYITDCECGVYRHNEESCEVCCFGWC